MLYELNVKKINNIIAPKILHRVERVVPDVDRVVDLIKRKKIIT